MILVVAATDIEMGPFLEGCVGGSGVTSLVTGVGLVEASLSLARYLSRYGSQVDKVINMGVGGAYIGSGLQMLDICMASDEVFGDLGICHEMTVEPFNPDKLPVINSVRLDAPLLQQTGTLLTDQQETYTIGRFVSVNCVTATATRGAMLFQAYGAKCENMEGAAVARVCQEFSVPCLEIRCISNMVENRNVDNWRLDEACQKVGRITAKLVAKLEEVK